MRPLRVVLLLAVAPLFFTGCGFVHFGRLPEASSLGSAADAERITNLTVENKLLKQELALVRRDGDTMRVAIERGSNGASPEIAQRMSETASELAALRVSYAKLQAERDAAIGVRPEASSAKLSVIEDRLAESLRNYTQLQEENARLRADLARARADNTNLAEQLKVSITQTEQAQASLAQLNTELLTHREARVKAEQTAAATRSQLNAIVAAGANASLAAAREAAAPTAAGLQVPNTSSSSGVTAELRINSDRMAPSASAPARPATSKISYTVQEGDTLEKIARQFYGDATSWLKIYSANNDVLRDGRPLRPGMQLEIPEK